MWCRACALRYVYARPNSLGGGTERGMLTFTRAYIRRRKKKTPHRCEYKSAHPKGIFASAWLDAHLFRQSGTSSRVLANNVSSASFSFCRGSFHFLFLDSVSIHERRMLPRLLPMRSHLFTSLGVRAGTSARKCDPSIPWEMCFAVTEKGTNSIASRLIMSKQSESFAPKITSSLWFLPAIFSKSLPTFLSDQKIFIFLLWSVEDTSIWSFFMFPALLFNLLKFSTRPSVEIAKPNNNTSTPKSRADTLSGEFLSDLSDISIWERVRRKHLGRGGPVIVWTSGPSHSKQTNPAFWQSWEQHKASYWCQWEDSIRITPHGERRCSRVFN